VFLSKTICGVDGGRKKRGGRRRGIWATERRNGITANARRKGKNFKPRVIRGGGSTALPFFSI